MCERRKRQGRSCLFFFISVESWFFGKAGQYLLPAGKFRFAVVEASYDGILLGQEMHGEMKFYSPFHFF